MPVLETAGRLVHESAAICSILCIPLSVAAIQRFNKRTGRSPDPFQETSWRRTYIRLCQSSVLDAAGGHYCISARCSSGQQPHQLI
jgi:hypothetical protein